MLCHFPVPSKPPPSPENRRHRGARRRFRRARSGVCEGKKTQSNQELRCSLMHCGARLGSIVLEEREGFEPSEPYGSPDFESGTFDHSATSPGASLRLILSSQRSASFFCRASDSNPRHCPTARVLSLKRQGFIKARPPMYGRSASGTVIDPSAFCPFSSTATSVRPTARPEPFSVCTNSFRPCALL